MERTQFKPGSELTFKSVVSVREQLNKALTSDTSNRFCLDLSEVTHCDSAGLALLIEAKKLCQKKDKTFEITGLSEETQSLAEFCGVGSFFDREASSRT